MARTPNPDTDFTVPVEGVGTFIFARRRMIDETRIQVEISRLYQGVEPTQWLTLMADWLATLKVLTVIAPEGWDLDEMDPLDDDTYVKLGKVYKELRAKEGSFRKKPQIAGTSAGVGAVENAGVLVSPEVPTNT